MILRWPKIYNSNVKRGTVITPPIVTELRDIFHTIVDIANLTDRVPTEHFKPEDGKSMLCLLNDPTGLVCPYSLNPGPWRSSLDMEHNICYNNSNHWNAITNGIYKYIFRANFGDEQLFDLSKDPTESIDVSTDIQNYATILHSYREKMIRQFLKEKRGNEWVRNGKLIKRIKGTTYSPNYPKS